MDACDASKELSTGARPRRVLMLGGLHRPGVGRAVAQASGRRGHAGHTRQPFPVHAAGLRSSSFAGNPRRENAGFFGD